VVIEREAETTNLIRLGKKKLGRREWEVVKEVRSIIEKEKEKEKEKEGVLFVGWWRKRKRVWRRKWEICLWFVWGI